MLRKTARLIAGVPETNADLLHVSGYSCPDPTAWFQIGRRSFLLVNDLELPGARRRARVDRVLPLSRYPPRPGRRGRDRGGFFSALAEALREQAVGRVLVPQSFAAGAAECLAAAGIRCATPIPITISA